MTFSLVWILVIANIVGAAALMLWSRQLARLAFVPGRLLVPGIVLFVLMGAWMTGNQMGDWISLLAFGALGFVMKRSGWSRPAFILGFIIGPIIESSLHLATQIHGFSWVFRPVCLVIGLIIVATVALSAFREFRRRRNGGRNGAGTADVEENGIPSLSLPFGLAVAGLAAYAALAAQGWPWDSRFFPLFAAAPLILLAVGAAVRDFLVLRKAAKLGARPAVADWRDGATFLWLVAIVAASYVVSQPLTIAVGMAGYLLVALHGRWKMALAQALCGWIVLEFVFARVGGVLWHTAWISI